MVAFCRLEVPKPAFGIVFAVLFLLLAGCAPAGAPMEPGPQGTEARQVEEEEGESVEATAAPVAEEPLPGVEATQARPLHTTSPAVEEPLPGVAPTQVRPLPTPTVLVEERSVELEWPAYLRYGDSDTVRLSLIPTKAGYTITREFPDHVIEADEIGVVRPHGYDLLAVARLDGVGFQITPEGERPSFLPVGEGITWRWTLKPEEPGQQHLSVSLIMRWIPTTAETGGIRELAVYSKSMDVRVISFFGLTRQAAMTGGLIGLLFGGGLSLYTLVSLIRPGTAGPGKASVIAGGEDLGPNLDLAIEGPAGVNLSSREKQLFHRLFRRYHRLVIEKEFPTGYSGARTFLTLPVREDGRADAYSVIKIDQRGKIEQEFKNYEEFVKHTLPPITARIQQPPMILKERPPSEAELAALQYTFIAAPGRLPLSLRESLLNDPGPRQLWKLYETFGPGWWLQRRAFTFRLGQEYDRMLPTHYLVEPAVGRGRVLDGQRPPGEMQFAVGDTVILQNFESIERRPDGQSLSLRGKSIPGHASLRVHWRGLENPHGATGRIAATRWTKLRGIVQGLDLRGLPDPLEKLPDLLDETVSGTLSTIHGDLNLENVLVGPGEMVWLIDFATTRDGHTLYDFAHLRAEIIAHVAAVKIKSAEEYLGLLSGQEDSQQPGIRSLLTAVDEIALQCLFNPGQRREYDMAAFMACVGALKFENLDAYQKYLLYMTAATISQKL